MVTPWWNARRRWAILPARFRTPEARKRSSEPTTLPQVMSEAVTQLSWRDGAGELSEEAKQQFWRDGFLLVEGLNPLEEVAAVRGRLDALFRGDFDTGVRSTELPKLHPEPPEILLQREFVFASRGQVYPDEWHWREGISLPSAPREICNAWKVPRPRSPQPKTLAPKPETRSPKPGWYNSRLLLRIKVNSWLAASCC